MNLQYPSYIGKGIPMNYMSNISERQGGDPRYSKRWIPDHGQTVFWQEGFADPALSIILGYDQRSFHGSFHDKCTINPMTGTINYLQAKYYDFDPLVDGTFGRRKRKDIVSCMLP